MYSISIQHSLPGEDKSLVGVFRGTQLLFRAIGTRWFVAAELGAYVRRIPVSGPGAGFEESVEGAEGARAMLTRCYEEAVPQSRNMRPDPRAQKRALGVGF
jgi:hypothetical protein